MLAKIVLSNERKKNIQNENKHAKKRKFNEKKQLEKTYTIKCNAFEYRKFFVLVKWNRKDLQRWKERDMISICE